jgi:predicted DNA-binding protein
MSQEKGRHKMKQVLYSIDPEQKRKMEYLSQVTGVSESELIRQAINMLMGAYSNALKGYDESK